MPDVFTRSVRRNCSSCGWAGIKWMTVAEAKSRPELRELLAEVEGVVGVVESVWECPACAEVGFFGEWESGIG